MNIKIETLEWLIWLIFSAIVAAMGWLFGLEVGLALCLTIPFIIMMKNDYIKRRFSWNNAFSVGIAAMDDDHKKLFEMIFAMYKSMQRAYGKEDALRVLSELTDYTVGHFDREEALMKKHAYPDFERHCREHQAMKEKVLEFKEKFATNSMETSQEVVRYLQTWLINHINKTDMAYSAFLVGKGEH